MAQIYVIVISFLISVGTSLTTYSLMMFLKYPSMNFFVWLVLSTILSIGLVPVRTYFMQSGSMEMGVIHKEKVIRATVQKNMQYLESPEYDKIVNRLKDSKQQDNKFLAALSDMAYTFGIVLAFCYFLIGQLSMLALINLSVAFVVVVFACLVNYKRAQLMYDFWQQYMTNTRKYNYISDILTKKEYVEEKKIFGYRSFFTKLFEQEFDVAAASNKQLGEKRLVLDAANDLIFALFVCAQIGLLMWCYGNGRIALEFLVSFIPFTITTFSAVCSAFSSVSDLVQIRTFHQDMEMYLKQEKVKADGIQPQQDVRDAIRLEKISFTYPNQSKPVILDLNLRLEKGKKYALVGVNGSGKTTLAKIIGGFYKPQSGTVFCSDKPLILFQDFNRYPFTVEENIALTKEVNVDKVKVALRQVGLIEKVQSLPQQEKTEMTRLKENGIEFSGGEWQRVALARILYQESSMVILDEPTASLDPFVEAEIYEQYMNLLRDRTVVFITHRLGYLRGVDEILVLNNGIISERGTHDELMNRAESLYRKMYQEQRSVYQDET